jgi:iron complex transport system permease protein
LIFVLLNLFTGAIEWEWNGFSDFKGDSSFGWAIYYNRLPRTILAATTGAAFALSGVLMQTVFNNPLAGPTTLGIGSGASLGASLSFLGSGILGGAFSFIGVFLGAFMGSILFLFILLVIQHRMKSLVYTLIIGLSLGYFSFSLIEFLVSFSSAEDIKQYVFWGMGSFNSTEWWRIVVMLLCFIIVLILVNRKIKVYNLMLLGEDEMRLSGFSPAKERQVVFALVGVLVALSVALVGPLAFVGVAIPNAVRLMRKTANHRTLVFQSVIWGAGLTVFADWFSRGVIFDTVLPVNAVLSIIAFPLILIFLIKNYKGVVQY